MESPFRRRPGSLRAILPKALIVLVLLTAVVVWMAGSLYRPDTNTTPKFTGDGAGGAAVLPDATATLSPAPQPPKSPTTGSHNSAVHKDHFWGVDSPLHFRGEGVRNRTQIGREKASLVMLVRNRELKDALLAMKDIEDRFNVHYRYPWTFLNDEPFTDTFRLHASRVASGEVQFGQIPPEHWSVPSFIDDDLFRQKLKEFKEKKILYGDSESYRHMCRYNSGFFWQSELLADYDWYWRVEPGTSYYCDQTYDPFTFMRENNKRYSFVMTLYEYRSTIESLWPSTREFVKAHPEYVAADNSLGFIVDNFNSDRDTIFSKDFNNCHFWSNFEIADLNLWRSQAYRDYFAFLDSKGGFFYERWGDAPVHSLAAALFLPKEQIHFWHDMGYRHPPYKRCPQDEESWEFARCKCPFKKEESFDFDGYSCQKKWWKFHGQDEKGKPIPHYELPAQ